MSVFIDKLLDRLKPRYRYSTQPEEQLLNVMIRLRCLVHAWMHRRLRSKNKNICLDLISISL